MDSDSLKKKVKQWADKIGRAEAVKCLIRADVSLAMTQKLVCGKYEPTLGFDVAQRIISVMAKDGAVVKNEAS